MRWRGSISSTSDGTPGASETATLSQIETAFDHYPSDGEIGEITVAQRQGDEIVYSGHPWPRGGRRRRADPV